MIMTSKLADLDDFKILTPEFEEDDEMAAARDVVTAELKVLQEGLINVQAHTPVSGVPGAPPVVHAQLQQQLKQQQHQPHQVYMKQEASGAAGSSCGASSPQVSCDTAAAKAQAQFWAPQQQQYEAAYGLVLAHSPVNDYGGHPYPAYGGAAYNSAPCMGPCCLPALMPQGSTSLAAAGPAGTGALHEYACAPGLFPPGGYGPPPMVPHAATGGQFYPRSHAGPPPSAMAAAAAAAAAAPHHMQLPAPLEQQQQVAAPVQRTFSSYPPALQGGVQKKGAAPSKRTVDTAPAAKRKSADGSCSSKDGGSGPAPKYKKTKTAAAGGPTARSRSSSAAGAAAGAAAAAAPTAAAAAASGSAAAVIRELQQEVSCLRVERLPLQNPEPACRVLYQSFRPVAADTLASPFDFVPVSNTPSTVFKTVTCSL